MANFPVTLQTNQTTSVHRGVATHTAVKPTSTTQVKPLYNVHRGALIATETTSAHVTGGLVHPHAFSVITQSQTPRLARGGHINNVRFTISESTNLGLLKGISAFKRVQVLQNTAVTIPAGRSIAQNLTLLVTSIPLVSAGHLRTLTIAETTTPKLIKNFGHTPFITESTSTRALHRLLWKFTTAQPTSPVVLKRVGMHRVITEATSAHLNRNALFPFLITESTTPTIFKRGTHPFYIAQSSHVNSQHALAKSVVIQVQLDPAVHGLTFHQPMKLTTTTNAQVIRRTHRTLGYSQVLSIAVDNGHIFRKIVTSQSVAISITGLNVVRFKWPIMGVIYQPTDQHGFLVPVVANLSDFHYWFNTDDPFPSIFWASSDLSHNTTNDQYNPWRTK